VRKALLLLVALALIAGGAYLFAQTLSHPNFYTILRTAGMAIFIALGAYLLWDDFVKPRWRRTRR
jgi:threonine/homoserine/homoserine lactone efflux protein